jgi:hypothetical protein
VIERREGDEIVRLNIFELVWSMWLEHLKAKLQAEQERKRIVIPSFHMSWFGPQEIPLPKSKANALASALSEVLRKAWHVHRWYWGFSVRVIDYGQQWCVEVGTDFTSLDKDSLELTFARNLVERELNGTIEVYSTTIRIRFPHHQTLSSQQTPSSFWSSLLAFWKKRRLPLP